MWKAVIMAGGEGSRLRPLTCAIPKPMAPLCGKPVMAWAVELLKKHGISQMAATLAYLPDVIMDHFGDGSRCGARINYFVEKTPLGTAGSVKAAAGFLDAPFIVMSGDALTDMNLSEAMRFHKQKGALATMVLRRETRPLEYGVVVSDGEGRVTRFIEKPDWGRVVSDTVNTGIYLLEPEILERVPVGKQFDFGRDLFPLLAEEGAGLFAYITKDYWCDIGDPSTYLRAHMDILDGRVRLPLSGKARGKAIVAKNAEIEPGALLEGPCYIGEGAQVRAGAKVGPYAVLGENACAMPGCSIKRTVLWRDAVAGENSALRGALLMDGARAMPESAAYEDSILGSDCVLGEGAVLRPGVKVWPGKDIPSGVQVRNHIVWGAGGGALLGQQGARGGLPDLSPASAALLAGAWAEACGLERAALGWDDSRAVLPVVAALEAGLQAAGVRVVRVGELAAADVRYAVPALKLSGGAYACLRGHQLCVHMYGQTGGPLDGNALRKLDSVRKRGDIRPAPVNRISPTAFVSDVSVFHRASLAGELGHESLKTFETPVAVFSPDALLLERCASLLRSAGLKNVSAMRLPRGEARACNGGIGIYISRDGEGIIPFTQNGTLDRSLWPYAAAVISHWLHPDAPAYCAADDTDGLEAFCSGRKTALRRLSQPTADIAAHLLSPGEGCAARLAAYHLRCDGAAAALALISYLSATKTSLDDLISQMPKVHLRMLYVPCRDEDKGRVMRALIDAAGECMVNAASGVRARFESGWVWVTPSSDKAECRILSEGTTAEFADEIGLAYADIVKKARAFSDPD